MLGPETKFLIVALITIGTGGIVLWHDRQNIVTGALAIGVWLLLIGTEQGSVGDLFGLLVQTPIVTLESVAILAGVVILGKRQVNANSRVR